jgi:hypothetical protein
MQFLPVPHVHLSQLAPFWVPFLMKVAERSGRDFAELCQEVMDGVVVVCLAWDEEAKEAKAAGGIRPLMRGKDRVAEIVWLTGREMKTWVHLFPQLEKFTSDPVEIGGLGCTIVKPVVRPGWVRILRKYGYRVTHAVMEKKINGSRRFQSDD